MPVDRSAVYSNDNLRVQCHHMAFSATWMDQKPGGVKWARWAWSGGCIGGNVYHAEKGSKRSSNIILRMVPFYAWQTLRPARPERPARPRSYLDFANRMWQGQCRHSAIEVLFAFIELPYSMIPVQINQCSFSYIFIFVTSALKI